MKAEREHAELVALIAWIDERTTGLVLPADERSLLATGCFDVALEHQAAIALLHHAELPGSMLALLRVLSESLVRGLWLLHCANDTEIQKFKRGSLDKKFDRLVTEFELKIGTPEGVLSGFKIAAWKAMNDFTHTGFMQVSRRHGPGRVEATYAEHEIAQCLDVAGAIGMIAAYQLVGLSDRNDLLPSFRARMNLYSAGHVPVEKWTSGH